jgi:outer membrane lipoprotein SlyB
MGQRLSSSGVRVKTMETKAIAAIVACAALAGCASTASPVLYPNAHLKQVGDAQSQHDIEECRQMAESHGATATDSGRAARPAAQGAATGAAVGAVGSAIRGRSVGGGAVAGAAIGGAAGGVRGAFKAGEVSPVHRQFVQRCLRDKGYDVIGWK